MCNETGNRFKVRKQNFLFGQNRWMGTPGLSPAVFCLRGGVRLIEPYHRIFGTSAPVLIKARQQRSIFGFTNCEIGEKMGRLEETRAELSVENEKKLMLDLR